MPKETGRITGQRLFDCDICGFTYRYNETGLNTAGLRVCFEKCFDVGRYVHPPVITSAPAVVVSGQYLTDADGNYITDADGNYIRIF